MADVNVYSMGMFMASVCAPGDMSGAEVAAAVNEQDADSLRGVGLAKHAGNTPQWGVSGDACFRTGQTNPCSCEDDPNRKHWLMEC